MEEKIEEIIYEFRIGRNMENPSKRLLTLFQETIEQGMPEKYQRGICSHPSTNHIHGEKEIPINFWTPSHDQYNTMIDEVKSNLLKEIGKNIPVSSEIKTDKDET